MPEVVKTRAGALEGTSERGLQVFRGIPYAKAPAGERRFRPPEPPEPWSDVRPARSFGPAAPQSLHVMFLVRRLIGTASAAQSQDCLYLNVWTPAADKRRRPVMVWIHGGAFIMGSGSTLLYSGARLASRGDVVVVTINYRLGALGFLSHPGLSSAGVATNLGVRDQIAALEWVRDNIEAFGGDPENVTIFGESAGAMSVGTLLGVPAARGLFHRAILQSGAAHNVSTADVATEVAEALLERLGIDGPDAKALRRVRIADLLAAQRDVAFSFGMPRGILAWQPTIDGDLLPEHPLDAIANGVAYSVPVLIGSNRDEWNLFMLGDRSGRGLDEEGLRQRLARVLPGSDEEGVPYADVALETYRAQSDHGSPRDLWVAFQSDRIFHYPALRLAELQSRHTRETYRYLFTWAPIVVGTRVGACHGLEIPFVFGTIREPYLRPVLGLTRGARSLSSRMQDAWVAFARDGDPRHTRLPDWAPYDEDKRFTMVLGSECFGQRGGDEERRRFWQRHLYSGNGHLD